MEGGIYKDCNVLIIDFCFVRMQAIIIYMKKYSDLSMHAKYIQQST